MLLTPNERRREIIEKLVYRKYDTMINLSVEFGVTVRTIRRDIEELSLSYPLENTRGRHGGGVSLVSGYRSDRVYMTAEQQSLLERLSEKLTGNDYTVMQQILRTFALKESG